MTKTIMPNHINTNERSSRGVAVAGNVVMPTPQCKTLKNLARLWKTRSDNGFTVCSVQLICETNAKA